VGARIREGQLDLFAELMRRHGPRLLRAVTRTLKDDAHAEDVLQEAYLRAYAHLDEFGGGNFSGWLTRIAVHQAVMRARRVEPIAVGDVSELVEDRRGNDPESSAVNRQLLQRMARALEKMPEGLRDVFELRSLDGLS